MYKRRHIPFCTCLSPVILSSVCSRLRPMARLSHITRIIMLSTARPRNPQPFYTPFVTKTRYTSAGVQAGPHTDPQWLVSLPAHITLLSHHVIVLVYDMFSIIMIAPVLPVVLPTTIPPRFPHPFYQPRSPMLVSLTTCLVTTNHLAHPPADQGHQLLTQSLTHPFSYHIRVSPCEPIVRTIPTLCNHTPAHAHSHALNP